jgi:hypothetical protein
LYFPGDLGVLYFEYDTAQLEIDHNYIIKSPEAGAGDPSVTIFLGEMVSASGFDLVKINDNYFQVTSSSSPGASALGDKVIQWGNSVSVYNNHFQVVLGTYLSPAPQHADVMQVAGSYWKIYDNYFQNIGESYIYDDEFDAPDQSHDFYVYNNVFWQNPGQSLSPVARGMDFQPEAGGVGTTFTDFYVANNVFANIISDDFAIRFNNAAAYTRVNIVNNLFYNCSSPLVLDPGINVFYNKADPGPGGVGNALLGQANSSGPSTTNPVSYVNEPAGDLHLAPGDIGAAGNGTNWPGTVPSFTFNTDKDGSPRPQTAWALGPYELTSTPPLPPQGLHIVTPQE